MFDEQDSAEMTKALYDNLLEHDEPYLEAQKERAILGRQGIRTGIILKSKNARGDVSDFELRIPKHAITMVCARTSGGKTTLMSNLAVRMVMRGQTGFFVTLEEPDYDINSKMLAAHSVARNENYSALTFTVYEAGRILAGQKEYPEMDEFKREIVRNVRVIDANKSVDLKKISSPSIMYQPQWISDLIGYRNAKSDKPLDFVIIDFGQLMETDGADNSHSYQRMKAVMQSLKNICGNFPMAIIIGAQMKRECMGIPIWDWEPELVRDGSDMEQAASLMLAIGQDKKYQDKENNMVIRYLKNRKGPKRVAGMFNIDYAHCHVPDKGLEPTND